MCGITGWVSFHQDVRHSAPVIEAMTATMALRGPDAGGVWLGRHAALGHRRLAVIDIQGGAQPMVDRRDEPGVVLTYSGEVYNHHQLRAELTAKGHRFETRSDTEVVLRAYQEWGDALVDRLEGMYAFGIWDERNQRLLLVRDRLGVKPLFWAEVDGGLVFGSEPKALFAHPDVTPTVDADGLREAYSLLFNTGPTVWAGVREVHPGGLLVLDRGGVRERRYWELTARPHTDDLDVTLEQIGSLVNRAARAQLEADVPLCSLLSGGLDSTIVTALVADELRLQEGPQAKLRSYAVDYSDQAEEFTGDVLRTGHDTPFAAEAGAFIGSDHSTVVLDPRTLLDLEHRRAVVISRDSPIGVGDMDTSLYLLFGEIRKHSTVALSGEAADEVFGGYPWFHNPKALAAQTFPWLLVTGDEAAMPINPDLAAHLRIGEFRDDTYSAALAAVPHVDGETPTEHRQREMQHLSLTRWLRQLLHRKDRLSMAQSLEVRVPYCDHRLVEYAFNTPWAMKSYDGREKSLLRATGQGIAPDSVLWRPKNHYPATHHADYNSGLQRLAREALDAPHVRDIADETVIKSSLDTPADQLEWGHRLRLERVVDLALWLDHHRPALAV
ncbi:MULTISPECIES: asparagine synthase (glutamine-hydrolyzing) [unclassified Streptomyces]|uniref:asparagine synthase (glutamine-hydrolyzing) n=1 Tax=Streptomycetaceae TaxID=2062 RepID=UPI002E77C285|nr:MULTISPECIES: asparagine synthase (glutamine-hydrolyzing) [unclassified Streptomyces]MED7949089.1 asparagine synthase (glutamine-hydrolyzing) [Streptomyces sp. BE303]MEE1821942.1 asparagine synthase (glutamine-hydrolyzing) [Streptomyces sp. BE20]